VTHLVSLLLLFGLSVAGIGSQQEHAEGIASLIEPAKLPTLKTRGAIPRIHKLVYQIEMARRDRQNSTTVINQAMNLVGIVNQSQAQLIRAELLRNHTIAPRLGCLDAPGLEEMKHGKSPTGGLLARASALLNQ